MQSLHDQLEDLGFQRLRAVQQHNKAKAEELKMAMTYVLGQIHQARQGAAHATAPTQT